jgi:hypothetical protein
VEVAEVAEVELALAEQGLAEVEEQVQLQLLLQMLTLPHFEEPWRWAPMQQILLLTLLIFQTSYFCLRFFPLPEKKSFLLFWSFKIFSFGLVF